MSLEKRSRDGVRRGSGIGPAWAGGDSRDGTRAVVLVPAARPVLEAGGRAIITRTGFPLYF